MACSVKHTRNLWQNEREEAMSMRTRIIISGIVVAVVSASCSTGRKAVEKTDSMATATIKAETSSEQAESAEVVIDEWYVYPAADDESTATEKSESKRIVAGQPKLVSRRVEVKRLSHKREVKADSIAVKETVSEDVCEEKCENSYERNVARLVLLLVVIAVGFVIIRFRK